MMVIPFSSDPAQRFTCQLGGVRYLFEARYNDRAGFWTFDMTRMSDSRLLVAGVPILIGQDLLYPFALGIGGIVAADVSEAGADAGPEDLGSRVQVAWLSADEVNALGTLGAAL